MNKKIRTEQLKIQDVKGTKNSFRYYIDFNQLDISLNDEIRRNGYQIGYELTERKEFKHQSLRKQYKNYKESYVKHLQFDPIKPTLSMFSVIRK